MITNLRAYPSSVRVEAIQGGKVLVLDMPATPIPVAYRGHYYRRVGNTTQEIAPEGLGYFLMQRSRFTWDGLPGTLGQDGLDPALIRQFARLAQARLPQIAETEDPTAILRKLRLLVEEQPTNAAILLFGGTLPQSWQVSQVHMGRFKDDMTIELARRELNELVQAGMLTMQGKGRNVHYVLNRVGN